MLEHKPSRTSPKPGGDWLDPFDTLSSFELFFRETVLNFFFKFCNSLYFFVCL